MSNDNTRTDLEPELMRPLMEPEEPQVEFGYDFGLSRRSFVQILGTGILIAVSAATADAQQRGREGARGRSAAPARLDARLHLGKDGTITVLTGKVEGGQGARAQISQAAAEELRIPPERIQLVMADTALTPDDGITAGSRTTPSTLPAVRQGCAAARALLIAEAARQWDVAPDAIEVRDGAANLSASGKRFTYADLAASDALKQSPPRDVEVTKAQDWQVLGKDVPRSNRRDIVTGAHKYPADIVREGMLYGKVLRPPSYRAKLKAIEITPALMRGEGVQVIRDGDFVGVVAPTTYAAKRAIQTIEKAAQWEPAPHADSKGLFDYLRSNARNGIPENPFAAVMKQAAKSLRASYNVAYVQHAPMEPRAAVAKWQDGKVTVWTSTQAPFRVRGEVAAAFHLPEDSVRVIVPDFGGGFGGKHTGETAVEAARLAKGAGKPVAVRWTRQEEFTWASFRPAAAIEAQASLDGQAKITSWHFVNINSGGAAIESPYRVEEDRSKSQFVQADDPPLRHGSYRALAATANNFARECFIDEIAEAAGQDPLEFRLAHLEQPRLRAVLEEAAKRFDWTSRRAEQRKPNIGIGLACGTEKGSFVAACVEAEVDRSQRKVIVKRICEVFECGAITSPSNLLSQVQGCILMGLGPALREAIEFVDGRIINASLWKYPVPRFEDVPQLDIHLLNRPDLPSVGAGETPIIAVAPAIANAVFHASGLRVRQMPIRLPSA